MRESFRFERPPRRALARHVASVWIQRSASADPLLPDAAVELVWSGRGLFVRGADTRPHAVDAFPDRTTRRSRPSSNALGARRTPVSTLAAQIGLSERHLLRR
jgi:hypothetical protein